MQRYQLLSCVFLCGPHPYTPTALATIVIGCVHCKVAAEAEGTAMKEAVDYRVDIMEASHVTSRGQFLYNSLHLAYVSQ